jgi:hypothetical protein
MDDAGGWSTGTFSVANHMGNPLHLVDWHWHESGRAQWPLPFWVDDLEDPHRVIN